MLHPSNSSQVRASNIRTLLTAIRDEGPISKRDLQQKTGLSWGSVSSLTAILLHHGYIVAAGKQTTSAGRKPDELDINSGDNYIIGIDLNVTGLSGVVIDMKGRILQEWLQEFPRLDYECLLETLFSMLDEMFSAYAGKNILGVGMAVQGVVNTHDGISVWIPAVRGWDNIPLRDILGDRYQCPVSLWHDPNCIMIAEREQGTPFMADAKDVLLIRLDQGIGMSIMSNGELHLGVKGEAGELSHIVVDPDGPMCASCGNHGCLGAYASGGGLTERFLERAPLLHQKNITYQDIAALAHKGDSPSLDVFRIMGEKMGQALSILSNIFSPELIVMYGDLCRHRELFLVPMQQHLQQHLYRDFSAQLIFSELGRNAAALGAALMVSQDTLNTLELKEWDIPPDKQSE